MEPLTARSATTSRPARTQWRRAVLGAAVAVVLAACGASAAGTAPSSTPTTTAAAANPQASPPPDAAPAPDAPAVAAVGIVNFTFTPAALSVQVGTTVVWTNKDAIAHTVNFMTGGVNSSVLNQNSTFSHTFTAPGTYDYICSIHPFMHGSITVTA